VKPLQSKQSERKESPSQEAESARLLQLIAELEGRLAELQGRLPAHSLPPAMLAEMDALDEQLLEARQELDSISNHPPLSGFSI
jgi:hypothetical protein